jgi:branched-chain amino acid transport system permease protein
VVVPTLGKWKGVERWTGGAQGLGIDVPQVPFGLSISFDQWIYLFALGLTALCFLLMRNLMGGRVGRAVIAIRDQPIAAASMGVHAVAYKTAVFGLSAMLVGMAGGLSAMSLKYVAPGLFNPFLSFGLLIGIAVGGLGSLTGALYGAVVLQAIFLVVGASASALRTQYPSLIYGAVLIVFLILCPQGIAGLVNSAGAWVRRRLGRQ